MIQYVYLIVCFIFNLLLWTYPFLSYDHPYQACEDDWPCVCPLILCDLGIFPGSSPYQQPPMIYSSPPVAMFFFHFSLSSAPYLYDWGYTNFHCDATHRPYSLYIHFYAFFSHYSTLFFYVPYIIDCMYIHVNITLVLKVAKIIKELIWVLLFIPLRSDKQDRVSQSLNPTFSSCNSLAFSMKDCALHVVCWVVTPCSFGVRLSSLDYALINLDSTGFNWTLIQGKVGLQQILSN